MAELIVLLLAGTAFLAGRLGWEPVGPGWRARASPSYRSHAPRWQVRSAWSSAGETSTRSIPTSRATAG